MLCTGPRCAHTMPLTMSDCVCSLYLTHSLLLSLSPHLFLFAWQLCKPAPLRLRTDRAIFSRHLISASRTDCPSAPQPHDPGDGFLLRLQLRLLAAQSAHLLLPFAFGVFVSYCYGIFKCYFPLGSHLCLTCRPHALRQPANLARPN